MAAEIDASAAAQAAAADVADPAPIETAEVAPAASGAEAAGADAADAEIGADVPAPEEGAGSTEETVTAAAAVVDAGAVEEAAPKEPTEPEAFAPPEEAEYDPSMPADVAEAAQAEYDPSMPADAGEAAEAGYDPSMPADAGEAKETGYDPSQPAEAGEAEASGGAGYDPSQPAEYDPSAPAEADESTASFAPHDEGPEPPTSYEPAPPIDPASYNPPDAAGYSAPDQSAYDITPAGGDRSAGSNGTPHAAPATEPKVPLPEGLTDDSPSVLQSYDLVRRWRCGERGIAGVELTTDPSDSSLALRLFDWAVNRSEVADARAWYKALAVDNLTASTPLLQLINLELALSNFSQVEELFAQALRSPTTLLAAADVNIWKAYLHYIRRQNPSDGPEPEAARSTVNQAYEFALKECGIDRESGEIWQEYIQYLAENKTRNPWEQQQNMDTIRKVYQRAVAIPLNNVEALWKMYDAFESSQNKQTAKKFLADRSPAYMTARTALREMRNLTDILPHPTLPPHPDFSDDDRRVVGAWRAYLKWEEGNPLSTEDESVVVQRVGYAQRKCMAQMRHFPELWHYAATYHLNAGRTDEGASFLKAGVAACPKSFLLSFALAEIEENRKNYAECHKIFDDLIKGVNAEVDELKVAVAAEVEAARGPEVHVHSTSDVQMDNEDSDVARAIREREERGKFVQERRGKDIDAAKTAAGIVWVMYMRFARRSEGLKAARLVFGKARKSPHVTWHIFEASAMMEYHSNKDSGVAVRIFELGVKQFADDVAFVIRYLEFLLSINDDTNARALFERSALKIPADTARPLWETWARFEYMHGDLAAVHKLEARWAEAFPNDSPLKRFAQRHTYAGIDEIALRDLGLRARQAAAAPAGHVQHQHHQQQQQQQQQHARAGQPPRALPPHMPSNAPVPPFPPRVMSPAMPGMPPGRGSPAKRERSPPRSPRAAAGGDFKRARAASPAPPVAAAARQGRFNPPMRDRSPAINAAPVAPRAIVPPRGGAGGGGAALSPALPPDRDRSGLPKQLAWFLGVLPSTRSFDGPIFRADDVMGLFANISPTGQGGGGPPSGGGMPRPPMPPARPPPRFGPGARRF